VDRDNARQFVEEVWDGSIVPTLTDYIKIPNKSPLYDPSWQSAGHMDRAVKLIEAWCRAQEIPDAKIEVIRLEGRTPLLFIEVAGEGDDTVLLYGHYDKQPEMVGWWDGYGPWTPILKDDRLYGRGGADDGYAALASLTAIRALQRQGIPHARCVVLIEGCEESGSYDLPHYIEHLAHRIGSPSLIVCLDSGCGNWEQLWMTTSLRGNTVGNLKVEILTEGVHSGGASGVVPSTFRILRQLLSRVENEATGEVLVPEMHEEIPADRVEQAKKAAAILGNEVYAEFPFVGGAHAVGADPVELLLNKTWRPTLCVTGVDGIPTLADGGNVLRPQTSVKLSFRLNPLANADKAVDAVTKILTENPPYGAKVTFEAEKGGTGWCSPRLAPWLEKSLESSSKAFFGREPGFMGEGGSIPFMGMLGQKFPEAQFMITGVLGPQSNAHGPNEFLHIPMGKNLTCCVAQVIEDHYSR
jgi:acetylornithine deacetylase/succinyl-diaminopimelate desuccinylase-like protein